jgi:hypothetical protein
MFRRKLLRKAQSGAGEFTYIQLIKVLLAISLIIAAILLIRYAYNTMINMS